MRKLIILISTILLVFGCKEENRDEIVVPVKYEGKFGFIDRTGNWFIEPKYDSVSNFWNGYASVFKDKKEGIIDTYGKQIIDCEYDFIGLFENGLALVLINDSVNYINTKGALISATNFFDGEDFSEGLAAVQIENDGKYGYIDTYGNLTIDTLFTLAYEFQNGTAEVEIQTFDTTIFNSETMLVEAEFNDYIINRTGTIIDTLVFETRKRKFPIIGSANNWTLGKLNSRGDTIMEMKYRSFGYPQDELMWFFTGERYGLADTTGTILIEPTYEKLWYFADNELALAKLNNLFGFIDRHGNVKIPFQYQETSGFKHGLAAVNINDKWGFINSSGELVIKPKFEDVTHYFRSTLSKREPQYEYDDE